MTDLQTYLDYVLTFGEHKGKCLKDVPVDYLKYLHHEGRCKGTLHQILCYFEDEIEEEYTYEPLLGEVVQ